MRSRFAMVSPAILVAALCVCGLASAQCPSSLTTTFAGGNGCSGNWFDVSASNTVTVCSFDVHLGTTSAETMEVWAVTGGGSYGPVSGNSAAWSLLATVTVNGAGIGIPTPLNLNLAYSIPSGTVQGFLIRDVTSTSIDYTNGTVLGNVAAANADLTIYEGQYTCTVGATFPVLTSLIRIWNGTIHYSSENILSVSQSGPGIGDLTMSLTDISGSAFEGWTLLSANTSGALGMGPFLGILPDATTWAFLGIPYFVGNPIHFRTIDVGFYPTVPFYAGPGQVTGLNGYTFDFVTLLITNLGQYDSRSNVVRHTFQ